MNSVTVLWLLESLERLQFYFEVSKFIIYRSPHKYRRVSCHPYKFHNKNSSSTWGVGTLRLKTLLAWTVRRARLPSCQLFKTTNIQDQINIHPPPPLKSNQWHCGATTLALKLLIHSASSQTWIQLIIHTQQWGQWRGIQESNCSPSCSHKLRRLRENEFPGIRPPVFMFCLCLLLPIWSWENYLASHASSVQWGFKQRALTTVGC